MYFFFLAASIVYIHVQESLFSRQAQTARVWQEILPDNKPGGMGTFNLAESCTPNIPSSGLF